MFIQLLIILHTKSYLPFPMYRFTATTAAVLFFLMMMTTACSDAGSQNQSGDGELQAVPDGPLTVQVQFLVDEDRYEEALTKLRKEDGSNPEIMVMLRDTHLHYGTWLMYHAEMIHMTERMPMALAHFRRVLELDPQNRQAQANIRQIEDIYQSMNREIPQGVAE